MKTHLSLLLLLVWAGCATPSPPPPPAPDDLEALSLLVERAVFATASERCAECPACREDFQSTFDILDFLLDEPELTLKDLADALAWSKVDTFTGPDGSLIVAKNGLFTTPNSRQTLPIPEARAYEAAMAVWVGLNKWK